MSVVILGPRMDGLQLPQELRDVIRSRNCVAFVGSGLSAGCYDRWHDLVNALCTRCGCELRVDEDSPADSLLAAAQAAKDLDEPAYFRYLGEHFGRPVGSAPFLYDAILSLPFKCYLTVNFDPLLALKCRTAARKCDPNIWAYPNLDRLAMRKRSIHYLHGFISESSAPVNGTVVLSRDEFDAAYSDNSSLTRLLLSTLENDPIVFIGCLLREPVMAPLFELCKRNQQNRIQISRAKGNAATTPPQRFIVLPRFGITADRSSGVGADEARKERTADEDARFSSMGITPVWYQAAGADHSSLLHALERLAELPDINPNYGWK
jgi:SIR2-like domain